MSHLLDNYPDRPEPATLPPVVYDWVESDPPRTEWPEPVTLDEPIAKALLCHDLARDQYWLHRSRR